MIVLYMIIIEISETENIETKERQQENFFVTRPKSLTNKKGQYVELSETYHF